MFALKKDSTCNGQKWPLVIEIRPVSTKIDVLKSWGLNWFVGIDWITIRAQILRFRRLESTCGSWWFCISNAEVLNIIFSVGKLKYFKNFQWCWRYVGDFWWWQFQNIGEFLNERIGHDCWLTNISRLSPTLTQTSVTNINVTPIKFKQFPGNHRSTLDGAR